MQHLTQSEVFKEEEGRYADCATGFRLIEEYEDGRGGLYDSKTVQERFVRWLDD